jgi:anti-anti-sigma regulatory factor
MTKLPTAVVTIAPDADGDCTHDLQRKLARIESAVTIDLSRVPYIPAGGLTELVRLRKRLGDEPIVLFKPTPLVFRTLNIVGFNTMFAIERAKGAA